MTDQEKAEQQRRREFREQNLWMPAREIALKAGIRADQWDVARLDLATQGRIDVDATGSVYVKQDGERSQMDVGHFFRSVYREMQPKYYTPPTADAIKESGGGKMCRKDFDQLDAVAKMQFMKTGGRVFD